MHLARARDKIEVENTQMCDVCSAYSLFLIFVTSEDILMICHLILSQKTRHHCELYE